MHLQLTIKGSVIICLAIVIPSSRDTKWRWLQKGVQQCCTQLSQCQSPDNHWQEQQWAWFMETWFRHSWSGMLFAEVLTWALLGLLCWFGACSWLMTNNTMNASESYSRSWGCDVAKVCTVFNAYFCRQDSKRVIWCADKSFHLFMESVEDDAYRSHQQSFLTWKW